MVWMMLDDDEMTRRSLAVWPAQTAAVCGTRSNTLVTGGATGGETSA